MNPAILLGVLKILIHEIDHLNVPVQQLPVVSEKYCLRFT